LFEDKRPKEEEKNLGKFQVFKQFQLEHSVFIASLQHFQSGIYFTLIHEHDVSKKADRGIILQDRDTIFLLLYWHVSRVITWAQFLSQRDTI
jgi:hypothetical protein